VLEVLVHRAVWVRLDSQDLKACLETQAAQAMKGREVTLAHPVSKAFRVVKAPWDL